MIGFLLFLCLASEALSLSLPICKEVDFAGKSANHVIFSGYTPIGDNTQGMYYIFYGALNTSISDLPKVPILVYLEGGPAGTSFLTNIQTFGPYELLKGPNNTLNLSPRNPKNTWNSNYSLLFIDEPMGCGASNFNSSKYYVNNAKDVALQILNTLEDFFGNCYSTLTKKSAVPPLILQGHSFGGRFVINLANQMIVRNSTLLNSVKGVMAVSPPIDFLENMKQYGMFVYNMGLVDFWERPTIEKGILKALLQIENGNYATGDQIYQNVQATALKMGGGLEIGNIRVYAKDQNLTIWQDVANYMIANKAAFNIDPAVTFTIFNMDIRPMFAQDLFTAAIPEMSNILTNSSIPLIIVHGQDDALVNILGQSISVDKVQYKDSDAFRNQDLTQWQNNGSTIGYFKSAGNFAYRSINKAGHMTYLEQADAQTLALNLFATSVLQDKK